MKKVLSVVVVLTMLFALLIPVQASALAKPTGVKATTVTYNSISIKWDKTKGADCYYIWYGEKNGKNTNRTKEIAASKTSYKIKHLAPSTNYEIQVEAYKNRSNGKLGSFARSKTITVKTKALNKPIVKTKIKMLK